MQSYLDLVARGRHRRPAAHRSRDLRRRGARRRIARWRRARRRAAARRADPVSGRHARSARSRRTRRGSSSAAIGRRRPAPLNYALVGAGAFGTAMLVPQMKKRRDRFFLEGRRQPQRVAGRQLRPRQPGGDAHHRARRRAEGSRRSTWSSSRRAITSTPTRWCGRSRPASTSSSRSRSRSRGTSSIASRPSYRGLEAPPLLMVGFNRRFSPALTSGQGARRQAPRAARRSSTGSTRGYIPLDHWVHGAQGGGRNIGEACHMYDVFRFLTGAPARVDLGHVDRSRRRCRTAGTTTSARRSATRTAASRTCSTRRSARRPGLARNASRSSATARRTSSTTSRS